MSLSHDLDRNPFAPAAVELATEYLIPGADARSKRVALMERVDVIKRFGLDYRRFLDPLHGELFSHRQAMLRANRRGFHGP